MSHSYAQNHIHLVFSTKNRLKLISKDLQPRLWAYVAGIWKNQNMLAFAVGGIENHIHVLFRLPPTMTLVRAVTLINRILQNGFVKKESNSHGKKAMAHLRSVHPMYRRSSSTLTIKKLIIANSPLNRNLLRC